ncbi:hypothetical protein [uncultured Ilyobacter sp.]|uniref:hypothetical protein n=1 Tax=uncultured Ilyobacter sp. TaxID=544433 RepID=UPI0029C7A1EA|nr:hypothetical protein [uncultured Ilyobacter sp.]
MFKLIVLVMLSFIVLYITNPTQEEFLNFYNKKINESKKEETLSKKIILESKKIFAQMKVERKDRYVYSIYTVDFAGEKEVYIGIFKKFILKEKVKSAEDGAIRTYNKIIHTAGTILEKGSYKVEELMESASK